MYEFYEKDTKNDKVILASSAIPRCQKISILTAEAVRRLRNTSRKLGAQIQNKHLNDFTVKLKDSGYSVKDRKEIIVNARKIFQSQCERDKKGIKPFLDQERLFWLIETIRRVESILGGRLRTSIMQ